MKRIFAVLAALTLLVGAVACTDDTSSSASPTDASAAQAQTASFQAPSRNESAGARLGDNSDPSEVVKAIRPSVVRIRAGGAQQGAFGTISRGEGTGTGFIVDDRGHIVTNNHVVTLGTTQQASRIEVDLWDGRTVQAQLVGRDERSDLAVLKIEADNLTPLRFADSTKVEVGDEVLAIGFALDLGSNPTVTKGVVSAKDRVIEETLNAGGRPVGVSISGAIQTDAAINPGNSGGPLVNMRGEVVGVNTAGLFGAGNQPVQGIFFAVSAQVAEPIVRTLVESGRVDRGFLGIEPVTVTREMARAQNLSVQEGAGLRSVTPGSAAERAGLRAGDVVTKIGDHAIKNAGDLSNALAQYKPGETVTVEFNRNGRTQTADVTLGERPAGQ
jgi:S1-C subfamily serine protease